MLPPPPYPSKTILNSRTIEIPLPDPEFDEKAKMMAVSAFATAMMCYPIGSLPTFSKELPDPIYWGFVPWKLGWIEHSDGRLYHPDLTAIILAAQKKTEKERLKKRKQRQNHNVPRGQHNVPRGQDYNVPRGHESFINNGLQDVPRGQVGQEREKVSPDKEKSNTKKKLTPYKERENTGAHVPVPAKSKTRAKTRPIKIPSDWQPNEANMTYLKNECGLGAAEIRRIVAEFVRYWQCDGRPRANWDLTFSKNPIVHRRIEENAPKKKNGKWWVNAGL